MRSIQQFLIQDWGYIHIRFSTDDFWLYKNNDKVICLLDFTDGIPFTAQQLQTLLTPISHLHLLFLVHTAEPENLKDILPPGSAFWCIHPDTLKLMVYENQDPVFKDLEADMDRFLQNGCPYITRRSLRYFPTVTACIALLCFIVFLTQLIQLKQSVYPLLSADFVAQHGGLNWRFVIQEHEYWRLISCMFIHYDLGHLSSNLFSLCLLGTYVERTLGKFYYLFTYFASGIIASLVSMVYNMNEDTFVVSAGASGAIFALYGALLTCTIWRRRHGHMINVRQIALLCILSLALSATVKNVDNAAHIGGTLAGLFISWLCILIREYIASRKRESQTANC